MNHELMTVTATDRMARLHEEAAVRRIAQHEPTLLARRAARALRSLAGRIERERNAPVSFPDTLPTGRLGQQRA